MKYRLTFSVNLDADDDPAARDKMYDLIQLLPKPFVTRCKLQLKRLYDNKPPEPVRIIK